MGSSDRSSGGDEVVHMEEAVTMLVEHLVRPVLPRVARVAPEELHRYMTPEKQQALAQQIHAAVILYNYYHRKRFPLLAFADARRFFMCACISVGGDLRPYVTLVNEHEDNSGGDVRLSVTDTAAIQACDIAAKLDASEDSPDMAMWKISKVAVLLLDQTRKNCLIGFGANTKGVWSIVEKEFDAAAGTLHTTSQPAGQGSTNKRTFGISDEPYLLQQLALSEVERRTGRGMKSSDLRVLDENLAYSLSKEKTTTKLFIVEYKQSMNANFVEMPLQELIRSMTGPIFVNDPFPKTTSVVEYYHILPYKEILFELLHRNWPADSSLNEQSRRHVLHSVRDANLEEKDTNSKLKRQKKSTEMSTPKQKKQATKATGFTSNQNYRTSTQKKNNKRKFEASRATSADGPNDAAADVSGGPIALESGVQVEKKETQKSICSNTPQDGFLTKALCVNPVMKNGAFGPQNMEMMEKSDFNEGGVTENDDDQVYDSLRSVQQIRREILHKERILEERGVQCDMDIQTIMNERKTTPKVLSIIDSYKETCSNMLEVTENGVQTMSLESSTLRDALHSSNKCQELDEMCIKNNWRPPRYTIELSVADGNFRAILSLKGRDFEISTTGVPRPTQREARHSAAVKMIAEIHWRAVEEEEKRITDAKFPS